MHWRILTSPAPFFEEAGLALSRKVPVQVALG